MPLPEDIVTVKIPGLEPLTDDVASDDQIVLFDKSAGKTKRVEVSKLPVGGSGGGGIVTQLGSPFKVRNFYTNYNYVAPHSIITDDRLIGKTDYVVFSTQLNAEFRTGEVEYNPTLGKVTIKNFALIAGEHITIYADGVTSPSQQTSYQEILDRLTVLEAISAPFMTSAFGARGGMVLWKRPASEIPTGWQEVADWRGRLPIGYNPSDTDFNVVGKTGGTKNHTISEGQLPKLSDSQAKLSRRSGAGENNTMGSKTDAIGSGAEPDLYTNINWPGQGQSITHLNPYRVVMFIEFVGL